MVAQDSGGALLRDPKVRLLFSNVLGLEPLPDEVCVMLLIPLSESVAGAGVGSGFSFGMVLGLVSKCVSSLSGSSGGIASS
jgi:hypothetical protein